MADWMSGVASVVGNFGGAWGQAAGYDPAYGLQSLYHQPITARSANAVTFNLASRGAYDNEEDGDAIPSG